MEVICEKIKDGKCNVNHKGKCEHSIIHEAFNDGCHICTEIGECWDGENFIKIKCVKVNKEELKYK